jgi:hypothetical protein
MEKQLISSEAGSQFKNISQIQFMFYGIKSTIIEVIFILPYFDNLSK